MRKKRVLLKVLSHLLYSKSEKRVLFKMTVEFVGDYKSEE